MNKKLLTNVAMIRPVLILLLVFYHAFAIFSWAWKPIEGYPEIETYWWLDKLSFAFMLEMFVFVSGYVFGYKVRTGGSKLAVKSLFRSKFKRLMIPCIVFSLLYLLIFNDIKQPIITLLYEVVNGVGHLWFLPMLFWCFACICVIERLKLKPQLVLPLLFIFSLCSFVPLPFQTNQTMYYMIFFYVGYILQKKDIKVVYKPSYIIAFTILFLLLFPVLTIYVSNTENIVLNGGGYF